jgi:ribonuclease E
MRRETARLPEEAERIALAEDGGNSEGDGSATRRRRRRARSGEQPNGSPDDPDNTVVKVREGRSAEDEITSVSGSTRLEAKKQRRREGREAGRRRAPIVSEAEFLARRESVKREMVVRQHSEYTQIAVLEDNLLVEHYVARESQTSLIGNVYLGKVQNVLPSMEAAFIDIGAGRNAVLYAGEVDWSTFGNGKARKIEDALSPGQTILVQVSKDPIGQKGARLTSQVSLPGRFLVYVPGGQTSGISRKLPENERARLKDLLKQVLPEDAGVIVRTAAEGATEEQLTRDVSALTARWEDIEKKIEGGSSPQLVYAEPDLVIKVVRDLFNEDFVTLVVEGDDAWDNISAYVSHVAPDLGERLKRWDPAEADGNDSFAAFRIDEQIHKALDRKVWLPSGGSLVIDRTEAMTVVDVNTGKFTGSGGNLEETVTKNNLEAAEEIVRQLRLRDIGGIIVIDFIDMVLENNRDLVLRRLVECLGRDRTRHQVAEVTSLGLVQMTRKRIGTGLLESFSHECEHCNGRGVVVTAKPVEAKKDEPRANRNRRGGGGGNGSGGGGNGRGRGKGGGAKPDAAASEEPSAGADLPGGEAAP